MLSPSDRDDIKLSATRAHFDAPPAMHAATIETSAEVPAATAVIQSVGEGILATHASRWRFVWSMPSRWPLLTGLGLPQHRTYVRHLQADARLNAISRPLARWRAHDSADARKSATSR